MLRKGRSSKGWRMNNASQKRYSLLFYFVCAALFTGTAYSEIELTPFAGYRLGGDVTDEESDTGQNFDESASYGFILNIQDKENTQYEFLYSRQSSRLDISSAGSFNSLGLDIYYFQLGGSYLFEGKASRPYLSFTMGAAYLDPEQGYDSSTEFSYSLGGGMRWYLMDNMGLRFDVRTYGIVTDSASHIFCRDGRCVASYRGSGMNQIEASLGLILRF